MKLQQSKNFYTPPLKKNSNRPSQDVLRKRKKLKSSTCLPLLEESALSAGWLWLKTAIKTHRKHLKFIHLTRCDAVVKKVSVVTKRPALSAVEGSRTEANLRHPCPFQSGLTYLAILRSSSGAEMPSCFTLRTPRAKSNHEIRGKNLNPSSTLLKPHPITTLPTFQQKSGILNFFKQVAVIILLFMAKFCLADKD